MKLRIITDRLPWIDERPHAEGAEIETADTEAATKLVELGFAEEIKTRRRATETTAATETTTTEATGGASE